MADVERYLDEVGRRLTVRHSDATAIVDELRRHLHDATSDLLDDGFAREDAERIAIARFGAAKDLGRDLTLAHRPTRGHRALVAAVRVTASAAALAVGLAGSLLWGVHADAAGSPHIAVLPTTGGVDNVMAGYIADGIARAAQDGAAAVVIELNTLGGSLDATQHIVSSELEAPIPVIVWVAPSGAKAASAGTFITLAGNIALMAPGTNIGAASPVDSNGQDITGTEGQKVMADAIASITSIAQTRHRNVQWAVSAVQNAKSSPASEAVSMGAVDGTAATIQDVINFANGKQVTVKNQPVTLNLDGASVEELDMNALQGFLHLLSDPNIVFILTAIGFYGLLFELIHPNFVTGILGGLSLILAFIGSGSLPLNVAGVILLGLSVVLLYLEATVPSHGLLTVAGIVCFVLGAATFYTTPGPGLPDASVSWPVVGVMAAAGVAFALVVLRAALTARRKPALPIAGLGYKGTLMVGAVGQVHRALNPQGVVYVAGEQWSARTADGVVVPEDTYVRVVDQDGLVLVVEPAPESDIPTTAVPAVPA
jgi:membrane-bound serine protease (ClpP class)